MKGKNKGWDEFNDDPRERDYYGEKSANIREIKLRERELEIISDPQTRQVVERELIQLRAGCYNNEKTPCDWNQLPNPLMKRTFLALQKRIEQNPTCNDNAKEAAEVFQVLEAADGYKLPESLAMVIGRMFVKGFLRRIGAK